jgi:RNA polymerase sigma factor (sigma-70 family)
MEEETSVAHDGGQHRSTLTSELVQRAATGDQGAWDMLVERYSGMLWSIARAYDLGRADAMDVVQTTWLRLVEHVHRVREPERVGTWLAVTARRESLRTLRLLSREHVTSGYPGGVPFARPGPVEAGLSRGGPGGPGGADGVPEAPGGLTGASDATGGRRGPAAAMSATSGSPSGAVPRGGGPGGPPRPYASPASDPAEVTVARDRHRRLLATIGRLPDRCRRLLRMLTTVPPATYAEISAALEMPIGSIGPTRARCLAHLRRRLAGRKP